jgi:hypothetical protein
MIDWGSLIYFVVLPAGVYVYRKIENLEQEVVRRPTKEDVKDMVEDKVNPLKEDLTDIKEMLNKLLDLNLKK